MARYIRTDELLATARDGYHSDFGRSMADLTSLREVIEDTPTADVVEVKHGKWKYRPLQNSYSISYQMLIFCNNCTARFSRLPGVHFNYCPNCGAKMDGGEKDEDFC